jgi:hypothetical protein
LEWFINLGFEKAFYYYTKVLQGRRRRARKKDKVGWEDFFLCIVTYIWYTNNSKGKTKKTKRKKFKQKKRTKAK